MIGTAGVNIDELTRFGYYTINGSSTGTKPNETEGLTLFVVGNGDYVSQIAIGCQSNRFYYRSKLNREGIEWHAWELR